jgi:hypothetical protein
VKKVIFLLFATLLHISWFLSIRLYYNTTYKKYLETKEDFRWEFVFKNKHFPYSERFNIYLYKDKIGILEKQYTATANEFVLATQINLFKPVKDFLQESYEIADLIISAQIRLNPTYKLSSFNLTVSTKKCIPTSTKCQPFHLLELYLKKKDNSNKTYQLYITSQMLFKQSSTYEVSSKEVDKFLSNNIFYFGARPAVGKEWNFNLGNWDKVYAIIEEKFTQTIKNHQISIFKMNFSSKLLSGYCLITEDGDIVKTVIDKPPLTIIREDWE